MRRSVISSLSKLGVCVFAFLLSDSLWAGQEGPCPLDICIPGFVEAQGSDVGFVTEKSTFDPGTVTCKIARDDDTITFFDPDSPFPALSVSLGESRTVISSCQDKRPSGTTGIQVTECSISTQFSKVGSDHHLKRQAVQVSIIFPYLGKPRYEVMSTKLVRNRDRKLVIDSQTKYKEGEVQCTTQNLPSQTRH